MPLLSLQDRVARDQAERMRLFDHFEQVMGEAPYTLDGQAGRLHHEVYEAIYPYRHIVSRLLWIARDRDEVIDLTWSERLPELCADFDLVHCRDCHQWCTGLDPKGYALYCPCCEAIASAS